MDAEKNLPNLENRKKGVYLLPSLLTTAALFSGFYSIVAAISGNFSLAALGIYVAMLFDGIDGRVARILKAESNFGKEYDSLSDMLCFGITPAIVIFQWGFDSLSTLGSDFLRLGWISAFIFTVCAACRLARFNANHNLIDKKFFQGLPSPPAASCIAAIAWLSEIYNFPNFLVVFLALTVPTVLGLTMVSNIKYYSFKDFVLMERIPFARFIFIPLILAVVAINPPVILLILFLSYFFFAPLFLREKKNS